MLVKKSNQWGRGVMLRSRAIFIIQKLFFNNASYNFVVFLYKFAKVTIASLLQNATLYIRSDYSYR